MYIQHFSFSEWGVEAELSVFDMPQQVSEFHIMFHIHSPYPDYSTQLNNIIKAYSQLTNTENFDHATPVMMRFFLSDAANQQSMLQERLKGLQDCAVSIVQQPPLDGSKIAMYVYMLNNVTVAHKKEFHSVAHNGYTHYWLAGRGVAEGNSEHQTHRLLEQYETYLSNANCTITDNCIRTWLFVQNVDVNYAGVVKARKENFIAQGLTEQTHYIASTGIEGRSADPKIHVLLDAYAVYGIEKEQVQFLYALSHLSPTYKYGVTFERGVSVCYGDRKQLFISGTASIDNNGEVVHVGNIAGQTQRMLENVEVLLNEGQATFDDVMYMTIYLRDAADYQTVREIFIKRFPNMPKQFVLAPVCRPTWLVEMECVATIKDDNINFRNF